MPVSDSALVQHPQVSKLRHIHDWCSNGGVIDGTAKEAEATSTQPKLYAEQRKFAVYPSAYANGWLVRTYKQRGDNG